MSKRKFFINLSNHQTDKWSDAQRAAAYEMAEVLHNIQFPNVPSTATTIEVRQLAHKYIDECLGLAHMNDVVVHLAGEATFVVAFVNVASFYNLPVVTATSERNTIENPDGTKTVRFDFAQFRRLY